MPQISEEILLNFFKLSQKAKFQSCSEFCAAFSIMFKILNIVEEIGLFPDCILEVNILHYLTYVTRGKAIEA